MSAATFDVAVTGRATTPTTATFTGARFDRRRRKLTAHVEAPNPDAKIGGAPYGRLLIELVDDGTGEPAVSVERFERYGWEPLGKCAAPLRRDIVVALQRAGGFDAVFDAIFRSVQRDEYGSLSIVDERLDALRAHIAWFEDCRRLAEGVVDGTIDVRPIATHDQTDWQRRDVTVPDYRWRNGETLDTGVPTARLWLDGEQIGWLSERGNPVPMHRPALRS